MMHDGRFALLIIAGLTLGGCGMVLELGDPRVLERDAALPDGDPSDAGLGAEVGVEAGEEARRAAAAAAANASGGDASSGDASGGDASTDGSTEDASTKDGAADGAPPLVLAVCDPTPIAPMGVCSASDAQRVVDSYWMAFGEPGGPRMVEAWCGRAAPLNEHLRDNHRWYLHEMDPRATASLRADVVGRAFGLVLGRAPTATELASTLAAMEQPGHHWVFFEVAAALGGTAISTGGRCTEVLLERTFQTTVPVCWPARLTCS